MKLLAVFLASIAVVGVAQESLPQIPTIERRLPPTGGVEIPIELQQKLETRLAEWDGRLAKLQGDLNQADIAVLVKAVRYALRFGEFYNEKELPLAGKILDLADERYAEWEKGTSPWETQTGLLVRGYRSSVDESLQPFGLEIPGNLDLSKPVPLLVWLHGRGDKTTDLHFIQRCLSKSQALGGFVKDQQNCIILHPFGRQCVGWKHAGEIDVFEAIAKVQEDYNIDPNKIALAGFSMGGAGAWHIGAHYPDRFCAVHTGAGFAETKEYNKLTPETYPPDYEQTLWKVYDVPNYIWNFTNGPLLAYSGGEDKQKQAADLIERELAAIGQEMRHVIGEGMGHKYNQESVDQIWDWLTAIWADGGLQSNSEIVWQTPTLRYPGYDWLQVKGLREHWKNSVARGKRDEKSKTIELELENVTALEISGADLGGWTAKIEGSALKAEDPGFEVGSLSLIKTNGEWSWGTPGKTLKRPGIQGPIDDAFMSRFIVVPPSTNPKSEKLDRWVDFELDHFRSRWSALMRGDFIESSAGNLDSDDIADANLILWGDPESNPMIAEIVDQLPIEWATDSFTFRGETYSTADHTPTFIFPNPLNPDRYVVINSGLTFRENHDRTNSLQNSKLPDWAVIGLDQLPDGDSPGRIMATGFFDEDWQ